MDTQEMLQALSGSGNNLVKRIATDILQGRDTIAHQKTICGKFLQRVFENRYEDAFRVADEFNKHAFIRWLIEHEQMDKVDLLIKQTGFRYRTRDS